MPDFSYIGSELEIFRHATNWKQYYGRLTRPYFGDTVLEVGAGIGATTKFLCVPENHKRWVTLEPDPDMAVQIEEKIRNEDLPACCEVKIETLSTLDADEKFDSVIYIDVLEHIEDDASEAKAAARHLNAGGHLIILSPAHQCFYTPFDKAIGHYRRYNKRALLSVIPEELKCVKLIYIDSVGAIASLANKLILRQPMPSLQQIIFWDKRMIPLSSVVDRVVRHKIGKSILGIWQKQ